MSMKYLGATLDIHGGGQDLIFPHHENEIAQSQAKTGKAPFVNVWMHAGFLNVEGEKMSKSLGNFITLKEALDGLAAKGQGADVLRLYFVQTHYRSKIDFSRKGLDEAAVALKRLEQTRTELARLAQGARMGCADQDVPLGDAARRLREQVEASLDDDVHTPGALAALFEFQRGVNTLLDRSTPTMPVGSAASREALAAMEWAGAVLTLFADPIQLGGAAAPQPLLDAAARLGTPATGSEQAVLEGFIAARLAARAARDWKRSDAIRDAAKAAGYLIEDTKDGGQRWRKA
jgi:cysteinyl-tRNA synthetase